MLQYPSNKSHALFSPDKQHHQCREEVVVAPTRGMGQVRAQSRVLVLGKRTVVPEEASGNSTGGGRAIECEGVETSSQRRQIVAGHARQNGRSRLQCSDSTGKYELFSLDMHELKRKDRQLT